MQLIVGSIITFLVVIMAYMKKSLNKSGFVAAFILGTSIYYFGGFYFWGIMISFFASSSLFTKYRKKEKKSMDKIIDENKEGRGYIQVIANGLLGLVFSFLYYKTKNYNYLMAYAAVFAASNADTWASEIGVLSNKKPVSIITFKPMEKGMSGGVTLLGTIFSLLGSSLIATIFFGGYIILFKFDRTLPIKTMIIVIAGFMGALIDSILGATIQVKYIDERENIITERKFYKGKQTKYLKGIRFINNDIVNFLSGLFASLIVLLFITIVK
ncbi:DUF92 domain-containing protein [Alkaliphilus sp. MSJ-5]|uniref:DUF92 domain-containing protein n=1 Tax=Alkaliphilus flagellatus TaxID=2841507 RepID=A0ABS6G3C2_9FIRM|nr:DUF92 domain-containing protein [Alkaliphilus flagellatus]MBU5676972.1 DUF92 domain-containing protein [Alkaliphilus flagellatus]